MVVHFALHLSRTENQAVHVRIRQFQDLFFLKSGNIFFFLSQMIFYSFRENKLKALYVVTLASVVVEM